MLNVIVQVMLIYLVTFRGKEKGRMASAIKQEITEILQVHGDPATLSKSDQFLKMRLEKFFQGVERVVGVETPNPDKIN